LNVIPFDSDEYGKLASGHVVLSGKSRLISKDEGGKYMISYADEEGSHVYLDIHDLTESIRSFLLNKHVERKTYEYFEVT
jgi:hypothetical protein